jgi:para-nitrobenzyl esterase
MPGCLQGPLAIRGVILYTSRELCPYYGAYFRGSTDRLELAQETQSENCLALNVLTPGLKGKRPVMVYIHGGGFGNLSTLITQFADGLPRDEDVVLLGMNHRLGVLGYLYLGGLSDKYAIGNVGQLDLIAGLEWVRDNIAQFGGDPGKVMVFGESGGGAKINTLLAMPGAKGLFHRAIVESGSLLHVGDKETATGRAKTLLTKLGLTESQVSQLQNIPAEKLIAAGVEAAGAGGAVMGYGPVVEGHTIPQQTWDPKAPEISASVPMIIGCCKDEPREFSLRDRSLFDLDEGGLRDRIVKAGLPESEVAAVLTAYHRDHPKDSPSDLYFRITTDRGARWNAVKQAELKVEQGKANVYMYYFAWDTPVADGGCRLKAFHTAELPLALRLVLYPESEELSKQISGAWAAFARQGNPNGRGLPEWPAYTTTQRATMVFDVGKSEAVNDPDREERLLLRNRPSRNLV